MVPYGKFDGEKARGDINQFSHPSELGLGDIISELMCYVRQQAILDTGARARKHNTPDSSLFEEAVESRTRLLYKELNNYKKP